MTLRDLGAFLWDIEHATELIARFIDGKTLQDYLDDDLMRYLAQRNREC